MSITFLKNLAIVLALIATMSFTLIAFSPKNSEAVASVTFIQNKLIAAGPTGNTGARYGDTTKQKGTDAPTYRKDTVTQKWHKDSTGHTGRDYDDKTPHKN